MEKNYSFDHVDDAFSVMTFGAQLLQGDIACPFGKAAASAVCHHRVMAPCSFWQAEQFLQNTVQRCHRQQIAPRVINVTADAASSTTTLR